MGHVLERLPLFFGSWDRAFASWPSQMTELTLSTHRSRQYRRALSAIDQLREHEGISVI